MKSMLVTLRPLCLLLAAAVPSFAEEQPKVAFAPNEAAAKPSTPDVSKVPAVTSVAGPHRAIGSLEWHTEYAAAYHQAKQDKKQLLLFFRDDKAAAAADTFERDILAHADLVAPLRDVVRVVLPVDALEPVDESNDDVEEKAPVKLLDHRAFEFMYKKAGLAVIDLVDPEGEQYGLVISAHPFTPNRTYGVAAVKTLLNLPIATVTQRALIFAVLMHPAAPVSTTQGKCHSFVCKAARRGSELMAQYESVGHHDWGTRQNEVAVATGHSAMEVAASGWGQSTLIDAAFQCVDLWYGSPAHWGIMSSPAKYYGYDLVRSASGNWYGTGVIAP